MMCYGALHFDDIFGDDGKTECSTELGTETSYRELGRLRESD
jgi:hypothetical protein